MKKIIILSVVLMLLSACSGNTSKQNDINNTSLNRSSIVQKFYADQAIPNNALFSWSPKLKGMYQESNLTHVNMDKLLKQGIVNALTNKGYRFSEKEIDADYTINYTAALESSLSDAEVLKEFGAQPGLVTTKKVDPKVEKGTLIVDIINRTTGRLHWRSSGQMLAHLEQVPQKLREQRIEKLLKLMFTDLH